MPIKRTNKALPTNRVVLLRIIMVLAFLVVAGRLFQVSVLDHSKALASATNQYSVKQTIQAKRGKIYFRDLNGGNNFPVALNIDTFTVLADPFLIKDTNTAVAALAPALQMDAQELHTKLDDKTKRYVVLKKKLTQADKETVAKVNLKGLTFLTVPTRFYPESSLAAQVIGFVNTDGEGQAGIERFFNEDLKGYNGLVVGQKDAKRRIIAEGNSAQPKDGTTIVLSIDHNIQYMVEQDLKNAIDKYQADSGSVVIEDIKTGAILAMANMPSFDPNNYGAVPQDQQQAFVNSAVTTPWEPGSIFKTFTLSSGMDMGLFDPTTEIKLACSVTVNGFTIHNSEDKCYDHPNFLQVLAQSINIGTIWAADKMGNDNFYKYMTDFGFGSKTGIELQPESNGRILPVKQWQDVNRATMSFGQGLSVTPLQIVNGYAAIANGGKLMRPYIVSQRIEDDGKQIDTKPTELHQVLKPETIPKINQLLEDVVTDGHGKKAAVPGYKIAGKTGTAQVVGSDGKYEANSHIGSFAGYFPSDNPQFAMVVKLDRPKAVDFAESSAAPTFGEIAKWLLHYAKVPPSSTVN